MSLIVRTNSINQVQKSIKDRNVATVKESAEFMRDYAQSIAPVRTGAFAASIHVEGPDGAGTGKSEAIVRGAAVPGRFLEEGTRYMGPRPTFRPAAEATRPQFVEAMTHVADDA